MKEQRRHKRLPLDAVVFYRIENGEPENTSKVGTPLSVDISESGLQIEADREIPAGTDLKMILSLPPAPQTMEIYGRTMWIKKTDTDHFKIGIEFIRFRYSSIREVIRKYVDSGG